MLVSPMKTAECTVLLLPAPMGWGEMLPNRPVSKVAKLGGGVAEPAYMAAGIDS